MIIMPFTKEQREFLQSIKDKDNTWLDRKYNIEEPKEEDFQNTIDWIKECEIYREKKEIIDRRKYDYRRQLFSRIYKRAKLMNQDIQLYTEVLKKMIRY